MISRSCMLRHWRRNIFLIAFLALVFAAGRVSFAQTNFGSLRGTITDANGAAVAGATINVKDVGTNQVFTFTTNEEGIYAAPSLRPVTYDITVEAAGFKTSTIRSVKVDTAKDI